MTAVETDFIHIAAVLVAGLLAGFINIVAGGGSLLTLPALIFLGLPAQMANATNRVGVLMQNIVASGTFQRQGRLPLRLGSTLALASIPGAVLGAFLAVEMDEKLFRRVLAGVMLLVLAAILRKGRRPPVEVRQAAPDYPLLLFASYLFIGFYSGFIQAGVGFIIIAVLTSFAGLDLIRSNAVKVFTILVFQAAALVVFAAAGSVHWIWGLTLSTGMMIGGWAGVRWQVKSGEKWVRRLLIAAILVFAFKLVI